MRTDGKDKMHAACSLDHASADDFSKLIASFGNNAVQEMMHATRSSINTCSIAVIAPDQL